MKTIRKLLRIIVMLIVILQISSCTEDSTIDTLPETTGQATFWIGSNLGVGNITVTCNGNS